MKIFLDTETRSTVNLKETGADYYVNHKDTELLSAVLFYNNKYDFYVTENPYIKSSMTIEELGKILSNNTVIAHNAPFDKLVVDRFIPQINIEWIDTIPLCRQAGLPGELDKIAQILFKESKLDSKSMLILSQIQTRNGKKIVPVGTKYLWENFMAYNVKDVDLLYRIYSIVQAYNYEPDVISVDRKINERGIYIDTEFTKKLSELYAQNEQTAQGKLHDIAPGLNVRSPKQVHEFLQKHNIRLDSINKNTLEQFLSTPEVYRIEDTGDDNQYAAAIEVLKLRNEIARASKGKIERIKLLSAFSSGRIKNQFVYYGAHTGRWSGRQLQPHNFTRNTIGLPIEQLVNRIKNGFTYDDLINLSIDYKKRPSDILAILTRGCIAASPGYLLHKVDYASIEARCVAWLADEITLLKLYRTNGDPYIDMAKKVFGVEEVTKTQRQVGKQIILGCGYGMSGNKFDINAKLIYNINLELLNLTADKCVRTYRESYPAIPYLWREYNTAAELAIYTDKKHEAGKCIFWVLGGNLHIQLPTGRVLVYRNCRIEDRIPGYCKVFGLEPFYKPTIVYDNPKGYESVLYGGVITENVSQAVSRDLMAKSLVRLDNAGFTIVMHVHDEIVCEEKTNRLEAMEEYMKYPFEDFPIDVEGSVNVCFT